MNNNTPRLVQALALSVNTVIDGGRITHIARGPVNTYVTVNGKRIKIRHEDRVWTYPQ